MDTLEDVQDTDVWADVVELIERSANTLFVLSGRRAREACQDLCRVFKDKEIQYIELGPLSDDEVAAYIQEKENRLNVSLDPAIRKGIVLIAQGRPILVDLAVEFGEVGTAADEEERDIA